jgi:phytol kinase
VTRLTETLAANTWLAMGVMLGAFLALYALLHLYTRFTAARPETTRKMFHTGSGVLTLAFPFLFREPWPVLALTGASALFIAAIKFLPSLRARAGGVANRVDRSTLGEIYFPLSVALLFWLTRGEDPLLFVIPILVLTFADATCALVGGRYGLTPYVGASKSLEGSVAFVVIAFFCIHVPLLLWSGVGRAESLLIATTLALLVMVLEGSAWRGLDNLFIPIGGYFLLRAYLDMDAAALAARLLVTSGLVALIIIARRKTTLGDDSLAAGAFLCYLAWASMGWPWLVGPFAILLGYRWLSPPTEDNSRRMHGVAAILSIWAPAVLWLVLGRALSDPSLLLPYTVVFAAQLAMFGISRLAFQFPARRLDAIFARVVVTSAAIVLIPFVLATGRDVATVARALSTLPAVAAGAALFVRAQPDIRNAEATPRRWITQGAAAALASLAAWGSAVAVTRVLG